MTIQTKSCKYCTHKASCDVWKDQSELTVSGWNKNRFALCCNEYNSKKQKGKSYERV